jgi:hypothetical protein
MIGEQLLMPRPEAETSLRLGAAGALSGLSSNSSNTPANAKVQA